MIVISGITSSLGISLAKRLAAKGILVVGFARHIDKVKKSLNHPLIKLITADLNDAALMKSICSEAHGIVHLAALSTPWGKYDDFYRVNVDGTRSIIEAALDAPLSRFVHISTPSIYFDYTDRLDISESDKLPKRSVNAYAATKKLAEEVVDHAFSQGLPCITLRPRAIFGPHDQALFPRVLKVCQKGSFPCFRKNSPIIDITYVDNVAYAIELALEAPSSSLGEKYNITNGEPAPLWNILELLLSQLSIKVEKRQVPYLLAYGAALFSEFKGRMTHQEPLLTRYGVGVMAYSQTLSIEKAKRELKYDPNTTIKEGIKRYAEWLQTQ
ncbi:MAG: NAD(P)-dependent oxidoreductase [Rhabdochlamydiaceae bacterium]|jgi:nucleoside-diphosphate-sugar epimerase